MLTKKDKNRVEGQAEWALMSRALVAIPSDEHLEYFLDYVMTVLANVKLEGNKDVTGKEIIELAYKYNENGDRITHVSLDPTEFGMLFTLVRDSENEVDSEYGVLAYVYNWDCPDCSELGYVYYQKFGAYLYRAG